MIKFSLKNKAFYDMDLSYLDLPSDSIEITAKQHAELLNALNNGCIIFDNLNYSKPKPSKFHTWNGSEWVDNRTPEQIVEYERSLLPTLKRRQFMRVLVLNDIDLEQIELLINSIEDNKTRQLALIDWREATDFHRNDETLLMLADMLKLTPEKIDELWLQAIEL